MPYQEVTTPPLQILIGLGYTTVTQEALCRHLNFLHPASFEIIETGVSKKLQDYILCGHELLKTARELSDKYAGTQFGRPLYCLMINQASYTLGNSTSSSSKQYIIEIMSVLEDTRQLWSGHSLNPRHLQASILDREYREHGTEEALIKIVRFIISRSQTLQKRLSISK